MEPLSRWLLTAAPHPQRLEGLSDWWAMHRGVTSRFASPADLALVGGFSADRLAYVFA